MELTKCKLGELITQRREKNDGSDLPICGVSKDGLIPPKQKDADTSIYNVFYRDDFIFNPARMELNSIAINDMYDRAICSSLYEVFYVHRTDLLLPHYLELIIRQKWFTRYCEFLGQGSAREYCRFGNISEIEIEFPPIEEQQKIVEYNTAIENRIALKQKINDNLAEYLNCIYVELAKEVQETTALSTICQYVTDKAVFSDIKSSVYISTENILPDKQGVAVFGTASPSERVVHFREEDVLVSNIRPYFKKMWFATTEGGCNADVLCFRALDKRFSYLLKSIMYQDGFFDYVMSGAKGTKMPRGDKKHIMQYQIPWFSDGQLHKFNALASSIEQNQALNRQEMSSLEASKEVLLATLSR